jgi:hypothetical protein
MSQINLKKPGQGDEEGALDMEEIKFEDDDTKDITH